ncbi:hypothetical protein LTR66_002545 [Elasticomyces elasticus]|nr:hypothetical protein LTR66_002545 [Elasticomyces elasticus]KAK5009976.1 hypothetical protein LTR28_012402 [Elasticomyces elasticus]
MPHFKISVDNQSGSSNNYLLFKEPPIIDNKDEKEVFSNVAASSGDTPSPGTVHFTIDQDLFGVCGSSPDTPLGSGVSVLSVQTTTSPLKLGTIVDPSATLCFMTAIDGGNGPQGAEFESSAQSTQEVPGGFAIQTDSNFDTQNSSHLFAGIGATTNGSMVALATFEAKPSTNYTIFPQETFYIGTGTFDQGTIVDIKAVGASPMINFKGGFTNARLVHNPNRTYTVKVS